MVKSRQYNKAQSMLVHAMPQSQRSTLDLDSRQKRQVDVPVTEMNSTTQSVQISTLRSTRTRIACIICVLYIALASFIYTRDYVSQKNA